MDFDVGNQTILSAGAGALIQERVGQGDGWQQMTTAPRDGTPVELKNSYGVVPWYGLFRWTDESTIRTTESYTDTEGKHRIRDLGERPYKLPKPTWVSIGRQGQSVDDGPYLQWRPYGSAPASYIDPTGGMQDSPAYWRGAVAAKYGLPFDHFEKQVEQNTPKSRGFWQRLFGE